MNDNNRLMVSNIEVEEPLHDIVTNEFTSITFQCKINNCSRRCISYKWYKDGKQIETSRRIKISFDGSWYRLEITSVTCNDYGLYIILVSNNYSEIFSKANLYVREAKVKHDNEILCFNAKPRRFDVVNHLKCAKVLVGDTIELEARFNADTFGDYKWYKSNRPLLPNERTIVLNDKRTSTLSILCARETDTGIYHVICKSEYGIASSFASVLVINANLITLSTSEVAPSIDEPLPEEQEVNEGEEVRLMCKVTYDVNTVIHWSKNGVNMEENKTISTEYYNNRYTCLRIRNTCMKDSGRYSILMRDEITGHTDTSTCFLTVNQSPVNKVNSVKLRTLLQPTVTCIGSRISFNCHFVLDDPKFFYVVWYIGHYTVERTNHRFYVLNSGGNFFLIIKQIEPGMAGEVTCELRKAMPNRKSIAVNSATTILTLVPPAIIEREIKLKNTTSISNIYRSMNSKVNILIKNTKHLLNGVQKSTMTTNGINVCKEGMVITYCRLDDDAFYLDVTNDDDEMKNFDHITIYESSAYNEPLKQKVKVVVIEWCNTETINTGSTESNNKWFKIELGKTSDDFIEAGESSLPMFELKDPPLEQVMKFRIIMTDPAPNANESRVCITPAVTELQTMNKQCDLKPMDEFDSIFIKTGDVIGCGAFGSVALVRDNEGEFYAAKILKTRTQRKRDSAIKEYEMMKNLRHPKLVELHTSFTAKESFILVMDYLWGGELFDRIVEEEHIKEVDVVPYVRQICEALRYLHNNKIAHLDVKPENIICLSPNSRQVKIIDFGLARVLDEGHVTRAIYGTRDYVAPEVLNFEHLTLACDMWSLGVVTYMLLSGVMPFSGDNWAEQSANITKANYNYHESAFKDISDLAQDFVDRLLILQPEKRMKATCALEHKWIVEGPPRGIKAGHMKRTRQNLKSYLANNRARWQRAGNVMIAAHRLRNAGSQRNTADADRVSPRPT